MRSGTLVVGGSGAHVVYPPAPAPCPPWCNEALGHGSNDGARYHASRETVVKPGAPDVSVTVSVGRDDLYPADAGDVYVYLSGGGPCGRAQEDWAESLTPAAAVQLGQALIAAGLEAAGLVAT